MDAFLLLLAEAAISLFISLIVLFALSGPLVNILVRICPDDKAALFWLSYTRLMLTIAPLLLVLSVDMFASAASPFTSLRLTLMAALAGVLFGLQRIGQRLSQFTRPTPNNRSAT